MADNDVKIKISLDGADGVQKGLGNVGTAASDADSKTSKLGAGLKGAGTAFLGFATAAAAAGGALGTAVVASYAAAEQSVGGIETLFKGSADQMKTYAADAYKTAGLSANEYMEQATSMSASLIQSVGGDTAKAAELANTALIAMSDNANKMGTDLGAIQNAFGGFAKGNFTMLDNLKLGYGGTQEEMARLLADAEKLPAAMGQKFDMSNYGDVVTAIQLIQEEMGIAGTTATEASATISGSVGMLQGSFSNLLVAMGSANNESLAFLNIQEQAAAVVSSLETVINNVVPVIESIGSSMGTLGPQLGTMMETVVTAIAAAIPAVLEAGVALVGGLVSGIVSALPALVTALIPGLIGLVTMIATLAPQLIAAGANAVQALVLGLAGAAPTLIPVIIQGILGMVQALINALPMLLSAGISLVMGLAQGILQSIPLIIAMLPTLIEGIVNFIVTGVPLLLNAAVTLFQALITALPTVITQLVAVLPNLITAIIGALMTAIPLIMQAGITLLTSLVAALPTIIEALIAVGPTIMLAIIAALMNSLPQMIESGIKLLTALITAMPTIVGAIVGALPAIFNGIIKAVMGAMPQVMASGTRMMSALGTGFPAAMGGLLSAVGNIINGIASTLSGAVGRVMSIGGDIVRGIWSGISGAAGWLFKQISGFVSDVVGNIAGFFGIKSPSTRLRDEVGHYLPSGIGVGVTENEEAALKPMQDLNEKMMLEAQKLNVSAAFSHNSTFTQTLVPYTATPTYSNPNQGVTSIGDLLADALTADQYATISPRDMDLLATKVANALRDVRYEDGRGATLAVKQGVR